MTTARLAWTMAGKDLPTYVKTPIPGGTTRGDLQAPEPCYSGGWVEGLAAITSAGSPRKLP